MSDFLKYTLATIVGLIITSIIMSLVSVGIFAVILSLGEGEVEVKKNSVLYIRFDHEISDLSYEAPFEAFSGGLGATNKTGLFDILQSIEKAQKDDRISGIFMEVGYMPASIATIEEIRNALQTFKDSTNKFIISYSDYYTQGAYYINSVADSIFLNPEGELEFRGLASEVMFFTKALQKIGIEPEVIRHGKFKAAVEPFMLEEMSPENEQQMLTYIGSVWNHIVNSISHSRNITADELNRIADQLLIRTATDAKTYKFVDDLRYRDQIITLLKDLTNVETDQELASVSLHDYKNVLLDTDEELSRDRIAIVFASGEIRMGKSKDGVMGAETIAKALREARENEKVQVVVFRVNSPGGSALASEIILREVELTRQQKPIIVSMGDLAASGGYYVACLADSIIANPTTLTGSIGVFGLLFNGAQLLEEKIGITVDRVTTNQYSDIGSFTRKMSDYERQVIQESVEDVYQTFISHVATGRNMQLADVDSIGQGRIWSGVNAIEIGLIDQYGGLTQAIAIAQQKAGLENYRLLTLPEQKSAIDELMEQMAGGVKAQIMQDELGAAYPYYKNLQTIINMQGVQVRLPYIIDIK